MSLISKSVLVALPILLLTGCATDNQIRQDSKVLSIYIEKVKTDAVVFAAARDQIAKARTSTLSYLQKSTLINEQRVQRDIAAREVSGDQNWLKMNDALKRVSDLAIKQRQEQVDKDAESVEALAKAKGAVDVKASKLTEASASLAKLAEQPSSQDDAKFYFSFLKEVNTELGKKQVNAARTAASAAAASEVKGVAAKQAKPINVTE